jgi:hypothetical protein
VFIGLLLDAAHGELADGQQLARERGPLGVLGFTHQIEQLRVTALFEHIFDSPRRPDVRPPPTANLWMNSGVGITSAGVAAV